MFKDKNEIEKILTALSEQLEASGAGLIEMLVCGGSALNVLGYISRTTKDIDVVAFIDKAKDGSTVITKAEPLKPELLNAASKVRKDFNLPEDWINSGPASVMDFGLPEGLMDRVKTQKFGKNLIIHFLSRYDQIHFKLYAVIDQGMGKHYEDLMVLKPTSKELEQAGKWCMTHDVSKEFKESLLDFLIKIGFEDAAKKL